MADIKDRTQSAVNNAADAAKKGVDAAEQKTHGMVDKAADLANQGKEAATHLMEQAGEAGKKVQRWAGDAYEATADKVKEVGDKVKEAGEGATDLIRKYPIPALLVGFGVGLIIGRLLRG